MVGMFLIFVVYILGYPDSFNVRTQDVGPVRAFLGLGPASRVNVRASVLIVIVLLLTKTPRARLLNLKLFAV